MLIPDKKYSRRKVARPISLRGANHVVLKSRHPILRRHMGLIHALIRETQARYGVKLRAFAIMEDHAHFVIKVGSRSQFANALRFLPSRIAMKVAGVRLWRQRAWSRPIGTKRHQTIAERYVARNPIRAGIWLIADSFFIIDGVLQL